MTSFSRTTLFDEIALRVDAMVLMCVYVNEGLNNAKMSIYKKRAKRGGFLKKKKEKGQVNRLGLYKLQLRVINFFIIYSFVYMDFSVH